MGILHDLAIVVLERMMCRIAPDIRPERVLEGYGVPESRAIRYLATRAGSRGNTGEKEIARIFKRRRRWPQSRFCTGNFPVWYGALHEQTCLEEVSYHFMNEARKVSIDDPVRSRRIVIDFLFDGKIIDIGPLAATHPDIVHEANYSMCWEIAKEARAERVDGLLAPSVRHPRGVSVPVFAERAIKHAVGSRRLLLEYKPVEGTCAVHWT